MASKSTLFTIPRIAHAARTGLVFALGGASSGAVALVFAWLMLEARHDDKVRLVANSALAAVSRHARADLENLVSRIQNAGELLVQSLGARSGLAVEPPIGGLSQDPEFLDLGVWVLRDSKPVATYQGRLGSAFVPMPGEARELAAISHAFEGRAQALVRSGAHGVWQGGALFAVPLQKVDTREVATAHIRLDRFYAAFRREGLVRSALADSSGAFLAISETFHEARRDRYFGGAKRIELGDLSVILAVPATEAALSPLDLSDPALIYLAASFAVFWLLGFLLALGGFFRWLARVRGRGTSRSRPAEGRTGEEAGAPATVLAPMDAPSSPAEPEAEVAMPPAAAVVVAIESPPAVAVVVEIEPAPGPEPRWKVNNGSQVLGPWDAAQVAAALFAQEIDFDCVCWREHEGPDVGAKLIRESSIFGGPRESRGDGGSSVIWVYDSQGISGPFSSQEIDVLLDSRAGAFVCEESTALGWTAIEGWPARRAAEALAGNSDEHGPESAEPKRIKLPQREPAPSDLKPEPTLAETLGIPDPDARKAA